MESLCQKKIELYVDRSFGERFNAAMDFIKIHYRILFKILACFILPLCVIDATFINTLVNRISVTRDFDLMDGLYVILLLLLLVLSSLMSLAITFGLYNAYDKNPDGARDMKVKDFIPYLKGGLKKGVRLFFFLMLVYLVMMVFYIPQVFLTSISGLFQLLQYPVSFAMSPLMLLPVVYYFENKGLFSSLKRSFHLGYKTFFPLVGMYIIIEIITSFVVVVTMIPYIIVIFLDIMALTKNYNSEPWMIICTNFAMFLFGILFIFAYHFIAIITSYATVYHYGYAVEHLEHVSVVSDIENFEKMSDNSIDAPESVSENLSDLDNFENL